MSKDRKVEINFVEGDDGVKGQVKIENLSLMDHLHVTKLLFDTLMEHAQDLINKQKKIQNAG